MQRWLALAILALACWGGVRPTAAQFSDPKWQQFWKLQQEGDRHLYSLRPREALKSYTQARRRMPASAANAAEVAYAYAELGRYDEAIRWVDRYQAADDRYCSVYTATVELTADIRRMVYRAAAVGGLEAKQRLRSFLTRDPGTEMAMRVRSIGWQNYAAREAGLVLGQLLERDGDQAGARAVYEEALKTTEGEKHTASAGEVRLLRAHLRTLK